MKYRKKPVVVEAIKFDGSNFEEISLWSNGAAYIRGLYLQSTDREMEIQTPEGDMRAKFGDYIIKGVKGEFYPCKPDIFELTYEAVQSE